MRITALRIATTVVSLASLLGIVAARHQYWATLNCGSEELQGQYIDSAGGQHDITGFWHESHYDYHEVGVYVSGLNHHHDQHNNTTGDHSQDGNNHNSWDQDWEHTNIIGNKLLVDCAAPI